MLPADLAAVKALYWPTMERVKAAAEAKKNAEEKDFEDQLVDSVINPPKPSNGTPPAEEKAPSDILFNVITLDERNKLLSLLTPLGGFTKTWESRLGVATLDELPAKIFRPLEAFLAQCKESDEFDDMLASIGAKNAMAMTEAQWKHVEQVIAETKERRKQPSKRSNMKEISRV